MATPLFNEAFIIFDRDPNGKPTEIFSCDTRVATYVSTSIMICREMLKDSTVRDVFQTLAYKVDPKWTGSWYQNLTPKDVAELFIKKILDSFPLVFVDQSMTNPNTLAVTWRREWGVDGSSFESRTQGIVLNGSKIGSMCIAGKYAQEVDDPNSDAPKRFRAFLFQLSTVFMHELGHIFVSFLGLGKIHTPPHVHSEIAINKAPSLGEAGIWLEEHVYGGRMILLRNTDEDEYQPGLYYLSSGSGTHLVLQNTMDDFVNYKFKFPIDPLGPPRPIGLKTLGADLPKEKFLSDDPMRQPETKKLLDEHEARHKANPFTWGKEVDDLMARKRNPRTFTLQDVSIMARVPYEPNLRLIEDPSQSAAETVK